MTQNDGRQRIGSLWGATSKKGKKYLKGSLDWDGKRTSIVVFKNEDKKKETDPDFKMFVSVPYAKKEEVHRAPREEDDFLE